MISPVIAALCAAAAVLLLAAGAAKVAQPTATAVTLGELLSTVLPRVPRRPALLRPVARVLGAAECVIALAVLTVGGAVPALLLALAYAGFALVALRLLTGPRPVSCGCFGRDDAPITVAHVVVNVLASAVGVAGVVSPVPPAGGLLDDGVALAVAGPVLVGLLAWVTYLSITALPALSSARRRWETS